MKRSLLLVVAQQDAHHVGAEPLAHPLHEHVEQLVQLEVRERRLGDLLELPDRLDDGLGLRARRALLLGAALLGHVHHLPDVALRAVVAVGGERHAHDRVHHLAVRAHEALLRLVEQRPVAQQPAHGVALVLAIGGVHQVPQRLAQELGLRAAEQLAQRVVHLEPAAVHRAQPHPDRRALERRPEALLRGAQLGALLLQLEQHRDLRAQHVRVDRLQHVVHGAGRVAARDLLGVRVPRGQEDDRGVLVALPALDQLDGLEAVQPRHPDVHDDHGEVVLEEPLERLLARRRGDHLAAERLQHGPESHQALRLVVDHEYGAAYRYSQTLISERSWSTSTGFVM